MLICSSPVGGYPVEDFCCLVSVNNRCACKRTHTLVQKRHSQWSSRQQLTENLFCFVAFFFFFFLEGVAMQPSGGSPLWPESHRHPAVSASQGLET